MHNSKTNNIFYELTGIRAIAAYMVFFHHNNMFSTEKFGDFFHDLVNELHIGVTIFFVLSGFLICYRYCENIDVYNKEWILKYIKNRVARIYPMYFLMTTVTFIIIFVHSDILLKDIFLYIMNITFLRGFFQQIAYTGIAPGWTLTIEECFYFSAPIILILSKKMKLITPFVIIFGVGVVLVLIFRNINFYGFFSNFKFMLSYTYFGRCFEFYIGMKLALLYRNEKTRYLKTNKYNTLIGIIWIVVCLSILVLVKGNELFGVFTPIGIIVNNFILPIGIAFLFLGLITEDTILKNILKTRLFVLLGKSSYCFYLIHMSFISYRLNEITKNTLVSFVLINLISILLFKIIEEPCNRLIRKIKFNRVYF